MVQTSLPIRVQTQAAMFRGPENGQTVVLFALEQESRPFVRKAQGRKDIDVETSGMGRKNAEAAITRILAQGVPRTVITAGLAGALRPDLAVGDIVFETIDAALGKRLISLGARPVKFASIERVAVTAEEKRRLREQTGADVSENESGFVRDVCRQRGMPCSIIRVISDTANEDLPYDFNKLEKADGNIDYFKVLGAVIRAPWKLPALIKFWHHTRVATKKLSAFLIDAIPRPAVR
jgi:adenosylhomocysteine nucleosidase